MLSKILSRFLTIGIASIVATNLALAASPNLCTAVRGNGENLFAHFGALAKILEDKGTIDGMAGGSSASLSIFLYESMWMNKAVNTCQNQGCDPSEKGARIALLMKSVMTWPKVVQSSDLVQSLGYMQTLTQNFQDMTISTTNPGSISALSSAVKVLKTKLNDPKIKGLVNPEFVSFALDKKLLSNIPKNYHLIRFRMSEAIQGIKNLGNFKATSPVIFLRPGLVNFGGVAIQFGRLANFYADQDGVLNADFGTFLDQCAISTRGQVWNEIEAGSCGQMFALMIDKFLSQEESYITNRLEDEVGSHINALITTAVVSKKSEIRKLAAAKKAYNQGKTPILNFGVDSVDFGYTGNREDLANAQALSLKSDLKSQKFLSLGTLTWRTILSVSPAEPGLTNAQYFKSEGQTMASLGGWSDLSPVLALKEIGCKNTVYVTRMGEDSPFAQDVARQAGLRSEINALYDLDLSSSSLSTAIIEADSVLCTNWNAYDVKVAGQINGMFEESYRAIYTHASDTLAPIGCRFGRF